MRRAAALFTFALSGLPCLALSQGATSSDPPLGAATVPATGSPIPPATGSATVPAPPPAASAVEPAAEPTCVERIPEGKARPKLSEVIADRGTSGHVLTLTLTLEHGKGETVLPGGLAPQAGAPEWRELETRGLFLPETESQGPAIERTETGDRAKTTVRIGFVPLPQKPGRNRIEIPPLPVSVARASGDVLVLCTAPHVVTVEDPIANASDPKPRPNPPPRPQREEWTFAKNALAVALIALIAGALATFLIGRFLRRPKPVPPPPPPRPPWEIALEELYDVRHAGLVIEGRFAEHFDRVSDTLRKYLGARFGFDGLESTTREALFLLRRTTPRIPVLDTIESFLQNADLVKFARLTPSAEDCELALTRAETVVRATLPAAPAPYEKTEPAGANREGDGAQPDPPQAGGAA